jgi:hypothetical protein
MKLNSKTATIKIYGIFDSREPEHIRYIGKTKFTLIKRLGQHISSSLKYKRSGRKQDWIKQLIQEGIRPEIKLLCITTNEYWEDIERILIKQYKEDGHDLLNIHRGGKLNINEKPLNEYHTPSTEEMAIRVEKRKQTMLYNGGYWKPTSDSIAKGIQTKIDKGIPLNGGVDANKIWEVRRKNGTDKPSKESIEKGKITRQNNGGWKPNSGQFKSKPIIIDGILYESIKKASEVLNKDRRAIRKMAIK